MNLMILLTLAQALHASPPASPASVTIAYATRITDVNAVGTTVTNYGFLGNNFVSRAPSLEYPLGSGYEHLIHGGLWVGAHAVDGIGAFTGVTTGCVDGSAGTSATASTEFTPAGSTILLRSNRPNSPVYSPDARSELDLISDYDDLTVKRASGVGEDHRPLGIAVHQQTWAWTLPPFENVLFYHVAIHNLGAALSDVWVGLYMEFASGDKNAYSTWPPTSAGGGPYGSWYSKKWIQHDASLRLFREHYCAASPAPDACLLERVPEWIGLQVLTPPDAASGQAVTVAAWPYGPGDPARDEDVERYALMSTGTVQDLTTPGLLPGSGDPVELVAIGPFASIAAGDSVVVDFALVGGAEVSDIQAHAHAAQALHDASYDLASIVAVTPTRPGAALALEGALANPSRGDVSIAFRLADAAPATLTMVDVAGRGVWRADVGTLGPGRHVIRVDRPRLAPGVYMLRLAQGARAATTKVAIVR